MSAAEAFKDSPNKFPDFTNMKTEAEERLWHIQAYW